MQQPAGGLAAAGEEAHRIITLPVDGETLKKRGAAKMGKKEQKAGRVPDPAAGT
jgi:hypothetical protein